MVRTVMTRTRWLILILLLFAAVSGRRLWRSPESAGNLEIVPDSVEYAVAADRFAHGLGYTIDVSGTARPPRYPPWFSIGLLAPVLAVAHGELGAAILPVLVFGIASVLLAFAIGDRLAGLWAGAGAGIALLLLPAFSALAQLVMTEIPALALGLAGCLLYLADDHPGSLRVPLLARLCGAAGFALRVESLAILIPFGVRLVARERRLAAAAALLLPSAAVAAATAGYDAATFGSWHRTGYHYWCPDLYDVPGQTWGVRFVPINLERLRAASRAGALLLSAVGASILRASGHDRIRPALAYVALAALPGTLVHLVYFYPEARFHIFLLAAAAVIGGAGLGSIVGRALGGHLWPIPILVALTAVVPPVTPLPPPARRLVAETLARETPADAVIVTGLDPVFLEPTVVRGTKRTVVPASRSVEYASKRVAPTFGQSIDACPVVGTEAREKIVEWVAEGRPVFIDVSFLPQDAPLGRILDPTLGIARHPGIAWLGEVRPRIAPR
jgi:hypothetical protein